MLCFAVSGARATSLETQIDLNYTYGQTLLGDNVEGETTASQQYQITYEAAATALFDMLAQVSLNIENSSGDRQEESSTVTPSLELTFTGPRALLRFNLDSEKSTTEEFEETSKSETFTSGYVVELEVEPYYWPETKIKFERSRDYEEQRAESVAKTFTVDLRKEIGNLSLEFDYEYTKDDEYLPGRVSSNGTAWAGRMAYKASVWREVDVDLTYEVEESLSESFTKGLFTGEEKEYTQAIQARLEKSLVLTPRLQADFAYEYLFEQDLLLLEMDYSVEQSFELDVAYEVMRWLEVNAEFERETSKTVSEPPAEEEREVKDLVSLSFDAVPTDWLQLSGQAEWQLTQTLDTSTGGATDKEGDASYELSARQKWGRWWQLTLTGSSEYSYVDDWLTSKDAKFQAELGLIFFEDITVDASYDIERTTQYQERSPLVFSQERREEIEIDFEFKKDFTDMIQTSFEHELSVKWESEVDDVMVFSENNELTESTSVSARLSDFIRDMTLEGEITRRATDVDGDEEPVLIDITYALKLDYVFNDFDFNASFQYDDNGDTFDESSFNTKIGWSRENMDVSGEYQLDKTYADERDEERKLNLNLSMVF